MFTQNTQSPNVWLHSPNSAIQLQDRKYTQLNVSYGYAETSVSKIPLQSMTVYSVQKIKHTL